MKKNWKIIKLGELTHLTRGHNPPKSKFSTLPKVGYVRFYQIRDGWAENYAVYVPDSPQLHKVMPDDILMVAYRHIGKAFRGVTGAFNVALCKISNVRKDLLDDEYLFQLIQSNFVKGELLKKAERSLIPSMSIDHLKNLLIPLPPLSEQCRIIAILDEAFAAIAQAKENAEKNLINSHELFETYLQEIFINLKIKCNNAKIKDIAFVFGGNAFKSTEFKNEGKYQVLRIGNIRPGLIRHNENPVFIENVEQNVIGKALLKNDDVVISQTGTKKKRDYGFTALIDKSHYLLNQRLAAIRFSVNYLPKFFLYYSWTNLFKDQFFANETGTVGQGNVGITAITDALVPICSINDQQLIVSKLNALSEETQNLESIYRQKIAALDELKKSLLQKAFAGEL